MALKHSKIFTIVLGYNKYEKNKSLTFFRALKGRSVHNDVQTGMSDPKVHIV